MSTVPILVKTELTLFSESSLQLSSSQ